MKRRRIFPLVMLMAVAVLPFGFWQWSRFQGASPSPIRLIRDTSDTADTNLTHAGDRYDPYFDQLNHLGATVFSETNVTARVSPNQNVPQKNRP